jgi:hypothetical protein
MSIDTVKGRILGEHRRYAECVVERVPEQSKSIREVRSVCVTAI